MGLASIRLYVIQGPLSDGVCLAPAALALEVHAADDRSMLLGHVHVTE